MYFIFCRNAKTANMSGDQLSSPCSRSYTPPPDESYTPPHQTMTAQNDLSTSSIVDSPSTASPENKDSGSTVENHIIEDVGKDSPNDDKEGPFDGFVNNIIPSRKRESIESNPESPPLQNCNEDPAYPTQFNLNQSPSYNFQSNQEDFSNLNGRSCNSEKYHSPPQEPEGSFATGKRKDSTPQSPPLHCPKSSDCFVSDLSDMPPNNIVSSRDDSPASPTDGSHQLLDDEPNDESTTPPLPNDPIIMNGVRSPCTPPLPSSSPPPLPPPPQSPPPTPTSEQNHVNQLLKDTNFLNSDTNSPNIDNDCIQSNGRNNSSFLDRPNVASLIPSLLERQQQGSKLNDSLSSSESSDDEKDQTSKVGSTKDGAPLSPDFAPPSFTSFLPSSNDLFSLGAPNNLNIDSSSSDDEENDNKPFSSSVARKSSDVEKKEKEEGEVDTPSPLPDEPIECPPSPIPRFGSNDSSRSPSPAPSIKIGEKRRKSDLSDGSGSGSDVTKWRKSSDCRDVTEMRSFTHRPPPLSINNYSQQNSQQNLSSLMHFSLPPNSSARVSSEILSPTGSNRGEIMSPSSRDVRGDIVSPTTNIRGDILSPNASRNDILSPTGSRDMGRELLLSPPPSVQFMSPNSCGSFHHGSRSSHSSHGDGNRYSSSHSGYHHSHHHHHSKSSSTSSSRSKRARSPMDLPVPKWNIDPIYLKPKAQPQSKTPPYQKTGRTPPYQRENSFQKEKEIIILPVEPRRVAIPPSAEKLRRYSEDKEKVNDREKRLSIDSADSPRNKSLDESSPLIGQCSIIKSSQCSIISKSESEENPKPEPATPKLDFKSEVLGELGEFAQYGDTSIYTGPEKEIIEKKVPCISRIKEEEMNLLSPTKSRSKLPTSSKKTESIPEQPDNFLEKEEKIAAGSPPVVACIDTKVDIDAVKLENLKQEEEPLSTETKPEEKSIVEAIIKTEPSSSEKTKEKSKDHSKNVRSRSRSKERSHSSSSSSKTSKEKSSNSSKNSHHSHKSSKKGEKSSDRNKNSDGKHHHSSSSKKYDCSRCYKRSKIKRYNFGIQCKLDSIDKVKELDSKNLKDMRNGSDANENVHNYGAKHEALPRPPSLARSSLSKYKYGHLMHIETYPNGGASVCHMYEDEMKHLTPQEREEAALEFLEVM